MLKKDEKESGTNIDESAKSTNNINYDINGLCKTEDQFLGGKAALTALNYFTGNAHRPSPERHRETEEKRNKQESSSDQKTKNPQSVREFVNLMCEYRQDAEISKT